MSCVAHRMIGSPWPKPGEGVMFIGAYGGRATLLRLDRRHYRIERWFRGRIMWQAFCDSKWAAWEVLFRETFTNREMFTPRKADSPWGIPAESMTFTDRGERPG